MNSQFIFDNSYARLPDRFFTPQPPTPVARPGLIAVNDSLARALDLDPAALRSESGLAVLAGNTVPPGASPLAQVYAGHQFGGWSPQLGDGRAVLLGEIVSGSGRYDIQLKGAGPTPYSRSGDGRAWLGPVMREYIVSEAMHALGLPTTRALAAVTTGETVFREHRYPGAVLTRVAKSHIRVGTFQFFAARGDTEALQTLTDHVIARHYPDAAGPLDLLNAVIAAQADLVAGWMALGFIHGVMNTDNMAISGETIDYGPCAFMDAYHPDRKFSYIDQFGRYAYARQPEIAVWNLAQFATCLLPLMGEDRDTAIAEATEACHRFPQLYAEAWQSRFRAKLGLGGAEEGDADLIQGLLDRMAQGQADFTNTFRALDGAARDGFADPATFDTWAAVWAARRSRDPLDDGEARALMARSNPAIIARNHRVEGAIQAALGGDFAPFHALNAALATPFEDNPGYATPPKPTEQVTQTFCGT